MALECEYVCKSDGVIIITAPYFLFHSMFLLWCGDYSTSSLISAERETRNYAKTKTIPDTLQNPARRLANLEKK